MPGAVDWAAEAVALGERFRQSAVVAEDGNVLWSKPSRPQGEGAPLVPLGPHFYAGYTGVAFFLAALARVSGDSSYGDLAGRTLLPLRRQLRYLVANPAALDRTTLKLGGLVGLGSFLYSLVRIGVWLDLPELLAEAGEVATLATPERIEREGNLDFMYGRAGTILGLLALDREAPPAVRRRVRPRDLALCCGESLLARRSAVEQDGPRAWPASGQDPVCGFAHGASGIAYALAVLAAATGHEGARRAAIEGLAFERSHYSPEHRNWRTERNHDAFMVAWCNGAPGVALSRLRIGALLGEALWDDEIAVALETTATSPDAGRDFLCCGDLGRADILLAAFHHTGEPRHLAAAHALAAATVERARDSGIYRCAFQSADRFNPCLFTGLAGIGYALLRLAGEPLPCVLALE